MIELKSSLDQLPNLSLLAAACITYLADQAEDARKDTLAAWQELLNVKEFSLKKYCQRNVIINLFVYCAGS
jgi:hypothetical protein